MGVSAILTTPQIQVANPVRLPTHGTKQPCNLVASVPKIAAYTTLVQNGLKLHHTELHVNCTGMRWGSV